MTRRDLLTLLIGQAAVRVGPPDSTRAYIATAVRGDHTSGSGIDAVTIQHIDDYQRPFIGAVVVSGDADVPLMQWLRDQPKGQKLAFYVRRD